MLHLLLIDDNTAYCRQVADEGMKYGFEVAYFHNLEQGFKALESSRRYKALILDGHCMLESGASEKAKSNFVFHALQRLKELEHSYNRVVPFCVNTERPEDFIAELEGIAMVFTKGTHHQSMFTWLKETIIELPDASIRLIYSDVFEVVNGLFTEEEEEMLIDALQLSGISAREDIVNGLALLRRLLELLMDIACRKHLGKPPDEFLKGYGSRTRRIMEALQNKAMPAELFNTASSLYRTCSKYGSHSERNLRHPALVYVPRKYSYNRLLQTYLELVISLLHEKLIFKNNLS